MMLKVSQSPTAAPEDIQRLYARAIRDLPLLSECLSLESTRVAVQRSVAHRFGAGPVEAQLVTTYVESLHAADLGLAVACDAGAGPAWDHVVLTYRPILYRAAAILTRDAETGRELADGLWAELYGVGRTKVSLAIGSERKSLIAYFHGRARLSTWLRSVLAQRHIDLVRSERRNAPFEEEVATGTGEGDGVEGAVETSDPDRVQLTEAFQQALAAELAALTPADRLRLGFYYAQGLTLADIGRTLGEHEATVSRKLARSRRRLRAGVERTMRERYRLSAAELDHCYQDAAATGQTVALESLKGIGSAAGSTRKIVPRLGETERT